jgi:hypothetical protein
MLKSELRQLLKALCARRFQHGIVAAHSDWNLPMWHLCDSRSDWTCTNKARVLVKKLRGGGHRVGQV